MNRHTKRTCPNYLDLFAGAGGLSEGFYQAGFRPVAHVELNQAACYTLKTRAAMHWLFENGVESVYIDYLDGRIDREHLYKSVPLSELSSVINGEIGEKELSQIFSKIDEVLGGGKIDLIIGGPPCQAYSLVGRSRSPDSMRSDTRNHLYKYYTQFLLKYKPRCFVFENVFGLLSAKDKTGMLYYDAMKESFDNAGYTIKENFLSAEKYGVLQNRKRIIIIGKRKKDTIEFPQLTNWNPDVKVNEILRDLPSIQAGSGSVLPCKLKQYHGTYLYQSGIKNNNIPVTWHVSRPNSKQDLEIYQIAVNKWNDGHKRLIYNDLPKRLKTHNNGNSFQDRFKVVEGDLKYAHTVVAHIAKDGHYYIHPDISQNRSLTPREAARLQAFPDDYYFESESGKPSRTAAFQQIGNAVPVLLAKKIADGLLSVW
jgi:DNA (cytosine-5)-methyltransferase 1